MSGGIARWFLVVGLALPVVIAALSLNLLAGTSMAAPSVAVRTGDPVLSKRPIGLQAVVPPTLVPPTPTVRPTATAAPVVAPTPRADTYVVQPGDELKYIAADHGIDIFKLIRANQIDDPDSLRVGQILKIPTP